MKSVMKSPLGLEAFKRRQAQELERQRLEQQAELAREAQELERQRMEQEAELARPMRELERERLRQQVELARPMRDLERQRIEQEAEFGAGTAEAQKAASLTEIIQAYATAGKPIPPWAVKPFLGTEETGPPREYLPEKTTQVLRRQSESQGGSRSEQRKRFIQSYIENGGSERWAELQANRFFPAEAQVSRPRKALGEVWTGLGEMAQPMRRTTVAKAPKSLLGRMVRGPGPLGL